MSMLSHRMLRLVRRRLGRSIRVEIYERDDAFGRGIAISAYENASEQRRYDLFPNAAHMHLRSEPGQPRHYYPPGRTVLEYGELAIVDLVAWRSSISTIADWIREEIARRL